MLYTRNAREAEENKRRARVIGLTGGIGSGKTVATNALAGAGFDIVDADVISRELTAPGSETEKKILAAFPACEKKGTLDRSKLRELISADKKARRTLEELTHPEILKQIKARVQNAPRPVILSAPLLFESGLSSLCDCVITVVCPTKIRVERIVRRDGCTVEAASALVAAQIDDTARATLADYIVPSDRPAADFEREMIELVERITQTK